MKRPVCIPYALHRFFRERPEDTCTFCQREIESNPQCWRLFIVCSSLHTEPDGNGKFVHMAHSSLQNYHSHCAMELKQLCDTDRIFKVAYFFHMDIDPQSIRVEDTVSNRIHCTGLTCGHCGASERTNTSFPRCRKCKAKCYCSVECHEADWHRHKKECQRKIPYEGKCLVAEANGDQIEEGVRLSLGSKCMSPGCRYLASPILSVVDGYQCKRSTCPVDKIPGTDRHKVLVGCCSIKCLHELQRKSKRDPMAFLPEPNFECTL